MKSGSRGRDIDRELCKLKRESSEAAGHLRGLVVLNITDFCSILPSPVFYFYQGFVYFFYFMCLFTGDLIFCSVQTALRFTVLLRGETSTRVKNKETLYT